MEELVQLCGAVPVRLDAGRARPRRRPHVPRAAPAREPRGRPAGRRPRRTTSRSRGQGVRDVTRVAAGDPRLYGQIVSANSDAVLDLLGEVRAELDRVIDAVERGDRDALQTILEQGVAGTQAIPGKHGGPGPADALGLGLGPRPAGRAGPAAGRRRWPARSTSRTSASTTTRARPVGLVELVVEERRAEHLLSSLESRGWVTHR